MRRAPFLPLALVAAGLVLPAGPAEARKKHGRKKKEEAAEQAAAPAGPDVPDDPASRKFARALVAARIADFPASDSGADAEFVYRTLSFEADNTWRAEARIVVVDESIDCTESGRWTMEPAASPTEAVVSWTLERTDCPGRSPGEEKRALVRLLKSGGIDVSYR